MRIKSKSFLVIEHEISELYNCKFCTSRNYFLTRRYLYLPYRLYLTPSSHWNFNLDHFYCAGDYFLHYKYLSWKKITKQYENFEKLLS